MATLMPATSLAGKIQRGLGSGFLEALDRPRAVVESIVFGWIADDPRVNAQDEDRDLYYARLLIALGIDESPIGEVINRDANADGLPARDWLPIGVLGLLARAGRPRAVELLRAYVADGAWWFVALSALGATGDPATFDGLDAVLAQRFAQDRASLAREVGPWDEQPWRSWSERGPLLNLAPIEQPRSTQPTVGLDGLSAANLLTRVTFRGRLSDPATDVLVDRIRTGSIADQHVVEDALRGPDREQAARAVRVLGMLGDPVIVPIGERILLDIGHGFGVPGGRLRPLILTGFEGLPAHTALEVARRWRDTEDYRRVIATRLLELHATLDDLPWTVQSIRRKAAEGEDLFPWAGILRRFPASGPFDGFETIYRTYVPTCCRAHLIVALSVADPTFGDTLAEECLYDCERDAREAAARTVTITPTTRVRLRAAADDALEERAVRAAASGRMQ